MGRHIFGDVKNSLRGPAQRGDWQMANTNSAWPIRPRGVISTRSCSTEANTRLIALTPALLAHTFHTSICDQTPYSTPSSQKVVTFLGTTFPECSITNPQSGRSRRSFAIDPCFLTKETNKLLNIKWQLSVTLQLDENTLSPKRTLVLCQICHRELHAGQPLRKQVSRSRTE